MLSCYTTSLFMSSPVRNVYTCKQYANCVQKKIWWMVVDLVSFSWHWFICSVIFSPVIASESNCIGFFFFFFVLQIHPTSSFVSSSSLSKLLHVKGTATYAYTYSSWWLTADMSVSHYSFIHSAPRLARDVTAILLQHIHHYYWLMFGLSAN